MSQKTENENIVFRIITLGNSGVGKTSILRRYAYKMFNEDIMTTIGVNLVFKEITLKNGKTIKLKLIDTAGQEKYKAIAQNLIRCADGIILMYDINNKETFKIIPEQADNIKEYKGNDFPILLVGNKSNNNKEREVETEEGKEESKNMVFCFYKQILQMNLI